MGAEKLKNAAFSCFSAPIFLPAYLTNDRNSSNRELLRSAHPPSALYMPLRLESHPQTELNVAALLAAAGHDSLVGCDGRISSGEQVRARIDEQVRVVEEVEEFRAELPSSCLRAGA